MTEAVFPGSFDPLTLGHLDVIERLAANFPSVVVAVAHNPAKHYLFSAERRAQLIAEAAAHLPNVSVEVVQGLVAKAFAGPGRILVKGVRSPSDWENEVGQAAVNRDLSGLETLLLPTSARYAVVSSSLVKELNSIGAPVDPYVPPVVARALKED